MDPDMRLGIQMTHSDECYRWHHECAIVRVDSLRARIEDVEALTDKLFANFYPATLSRCHVVAEYLSKWLKEGK